MTMISPCSLTNIFMGFTSLWLIVVVAWWARANIFAMAAVFFRRFGKANLGPKNRYRCASVTSDTQYSWPCAIPCIWIQTVPSTSPQSKILGTPGTFASSRYFKKIISSSFCSPRSKILYKISGGSGLRGHNIPWLLCPPNEPRICSP